MTSARAAPRDSRDPGLAEVRAFWEANPLWTGESAHPPGSRPFFEEHRQVVIGDCLGGTLDPRTLPAPAHRHRVLDLGCGPGFWSIELGAGGCTGLVSADLTLNALRLTRARCAAYGLRSLLTQQNAERLGFPDDAFAHVNCQGVIHHTPDPEACVQEIARVLQPGGTASISVYYRNAFLRFWPALSWLGRLLHAAGARLRGRGREAIFRLSDADEIVRTFDGAGNPIGRCYSREEFLALLRPHFAVEETFLHLFPSRTLPFRLPRALHTFLDKRAGFMIYASLRKVPR